MAVSSSVSFMLAFTLSIVLFAGMQMYKTQLSSSQPMTILGGWLGSDLFILLLTAINSFENMSFGKGFQAKLIPEVAIALVVAVFASGLVHRVCATTCVIFSMVGLHYLNKLSISKYQAPVAVPMTSGKVKKRN
ncbi:PREDICTED: keratinocyte-associated protein 2-like [Priapulus caudatus]|uniref:Keratinocyte-associated protein 2-like n=1 Tax=Priapulus caudatus TaxID=37621 RepID=A0ABM1EXD1_PRICU|nr:PREDICTED: keratinocyte-associated protein 2-like [Priapulus caudatus]